jgi:hypothetical protein
MTLIEFLASQGYETMWELNVNPECDKFIKQLGDYISPFEYRHLIKLTRDSSLIQALAEYDEDNIEAGTCEGCAL